MSEPRDPLGEPKPLRGVRSEDRAVDTLGRWFAQAPPPAGLDDAALARVGRRLRGAPGARAFAWRRSVLTFAVLAAAGGAAAKWGLPRLSTPGAAPAASASTTPAAGRDAPPRGPKVARRAPQPLPTELAVPSETPPPAASAPPSAPAAEARPSVHALPAPSAAELPDKSLAAESQALELALTALRREHDAARALTLLERYAAEFPAGVLRVEADIARVDANLALGKRDGALALLERLPLALLERLPLERVGRGAELRLVRGELRATRDCQRANEDFDRVLALGPASSLAERALFGRASCRQKLGDTAGARSDFELYLSRYPNGRFAERARQVAP